MLNVFPDYPYCNCAFWMTDRFDDFFPLLQVNLLLRQVKHFAYHVINALFMQFKGTS